VLFQERHHLQAVARCDKNPRLQSVLQKRSNASAS
jgi:hypothetical protein